MPLPSPVSIYVLRDPASGEIRYVGQTKNPQARYTGHCSISAAANVSSPVAVWCSRLVAAGTPPVYEVIDEVPPEAADAAELQAIRRFSKARPLLNIKGVVHFSRVPMRSVLARWITPPQRMKNAVRSRVYLYAELLQCGHYRYGVCQDKALSPLTRRPKRRRCNQCAGIPIE